MIYDKFDRESVKNQLADPISKKNRIIKKISVALATLLSISLVLGAVFGSSFIYGAFECLVNEAKDITYEDVSPDNYYTTIYDCNGGVVDKLIMAGSNREEVTLSDIPDNLINAFIAIEDERLVTFVLNAPTNNVPITAAIEITINIPKSCPLISDIFPPFSY